MIILVLIALGLCLGSFVNALVFRLHAQAEAADGKGIMSRVKRLFGKYSHESDRYSLLRGRSMCPHCERALRVKDLVPVFSWLWLRGKCRDCKKFISWQYPLVEAALAALFVLSYVVWPQPIDTWYQWLDFAVWLALLTGMAALFVYDLRWFLLPDKIIWPLAGLVVVHAIVQFIVGQPQDDFLATLQFYLLGLVPIAGLYWAIYVFSKGTMVGMGDVKLGAVVGLALGWPLALLVLFLANVLGTLVVAPLLLAGKLTRSSRIPFGPFLIIAFVIAGLWGGDIINWYLSGLGLNGV